MKKTLIEMTDLAVFGDNIHHTCVSLKLKDHVYIKRKYGSLTKFIQQKIDDERKADESTPKGDM